MVSLMRDQLLSNDWDIVKGLLPAGWEISARHCGALRRCRNVDSAETLLRLILLHVAGGLSLRQTVVRAEAFGWAVLSDFAVITEETSVMTNSRNSSNMVSSPEKDYRQLESSKSSKKLIPMKTFRFVMKASLKKGLFQAGLACSIFAGSAGVSYGQIIHWVGEFNSSADIVAWTKAYGNPLTITFTNDAPPGGPSKGCMVLTSSFGPGANNVNPAIQNVLNDFDASTYTAIEMDVKVPTNSAVDQYGTASWYQGAVQTGSSYTWNASPGFNFNPPITTNNGWMHVIWPASAMGGAPTGTNWSDIKALIIDPYDNNYTNVATVIFEISNIKFTAPSPTYPNYAPSTFQFDNSNDVASIYGADNGVTGLITHWYSHRHQLCHLEHQ